MLSLSKHGPGSQVARYATILAGAGFIIPGPCFDKLSMTRELSMTR